MKQIFLEQRLQSAGPHFYLVTKLVNDAKYSIGQELTRAVVQDLCDQSGIWHVTITKSTARSC